VSMFRPSFFFTKSLKNARTTHSRFPFEHGCPLLERRNSSHDISGRVKLAPACQVVGFRFQWNSGRNAR
jgi:hypothetical protein